MELGGMHLKMSVEGVDEAMEKLNRLNELLREANSLKAELAKSEIEIKYSKQEQPDQEF